MSFFNRNKEKTEEKVSNKPEAKKHEEKKPEEKKKEAKKTEQKIPKRPKQKIERKQRLKFYFERAGLLSNQRQIPKQIFNAAVILDVLISAFFIYHYSTHYGVSWRTIIVTMAFLWTLMLASLFIMLWTFFYIFVDFRIYHRKIEIEEVLPDFLQLTASNITAGMTIDRALWFAVRPRFGVLAREIEIVAKETMSGADLRKSLESFASRYDSIILKRSINMLNEGMEAGGKIGELLNRISLDIQDQKAMIKDMSANLTTYFIFITVAAIGAAPFLFAMSGVLIQVVQTLGSSLGSSPASSSGMALTFSGTGVSIDDFRTFAILSLTITSFFSAVMISTIKKGNAKSGAKYIPIFIAVSLTLYFFVGTFANKFLGLFFG